MDDPLHIGWDYYRTLCCERLKKVLNRSSCAFSPLSSHDWRNEKIVLSFLPDSLASLSTKIFYSMWPLSLKVFLMRKILRHTHTHTHTHTHGKKEEGKEGRHKKQREKDIKIWRYREWEWVREWMRECVRVDVRLSEKESISVCVCVCVSERRHLSRFVCLKKTFAAFRFF